MTRYQKRLPLLFLTLFFITINMRPPVSTVGPLLGEIQQSLGLQPFQTALLAAVPVVCFGFGAFLTPLLVARLGIIDTFTWILVVMSATLAARPWFGYWILLILSVLAGLGIALANVAITTLVRQEFPTQVAKITAFYTALLGVFASVGASLSVPLRNLFGSWQGSLSSWGLLAALGLALWLLVNRGLGHDHSRGSQNHIFNPAVWASGATWGIVGYFGLQSLNFYALLNWLPTILESKGFDQAGAGALLGFTTVVGVPTGLLITANLRRIKSVGALMLGIGAVTTAGLLLLLLPAEWSWLATGLAGCGLGASFPLSIALIGIKGKSSETTTALSAISQGFGYLVAAAGTYVIGVVGASAAGWAASIWTLIVVTLVGVAFGFLVNRSHAV